jgi:hypothetical protein
MSKQAISVTLSAENLVWLRARTVALGRRSVSDTLDGLVSEARGRERGLIAARSVAGTLRIAGDDPDLSTADAAVRDLFSASLGAGYAPAEGRGRRSRVAARDPRG